MSFHTNEKEWVDIINAARNQMGLSGAELGGYLIARSLERVAYAVRYLGNGEADTPLGAIESLTRTVDVLADSVGAIATAIDNKQV